MAPKINKKISNYNYTAYRSRDIRYIVIHWVGAVSTAKNNAENTNMFTESPNNGTMDIS